MTFGAATGAERPYRPAPQRSIITIGLGRVGATRPEGGVKGGTILATGTPEQVSAQRDSYTGQFLRDLLGNPARARTA